MASGRKSSITWFLSYLQGSREATAIYKYVDSCTYVNLRRLGNIPVSWFGFIHWNPLLFLVLFPGVMEGSGGFGEGGGIWKFSKQRISPSATSMLLSEGQRRLQHKIRGLDAKERWLKEASLSSKRLFFSFPYLTRGHIWHLPHMLLCCKHLCHRGFSPCVTS